MRPHAPLSLGAAAIGYDANGNMVADGTRLLAWDEANRLSSVEIGAALTAFGYGPDGARARKTTATTAVLYAGADVEIDDSDVSDVAGDYTRYPHPDLKIVGAAKFFLHRDHLASVRLVSTATGTIAEQSAYAAYGEQLNSGFQTRKGFIGERYDPETGLLYLNARYMDPRWGRFISPDDWDPTQDGVGTNRYAYAGNDPVNKADNNGHFAVVGGAAGAIVGIAVQAGIDAYNGELSGVGAYAGAAVGGAVAGATAGLASGAGMGVYGASALSGILGSVSSGITDDAVSGRQLSLSRVATDAAIGGAFGVAGGYLGTKLSQSLDNLTPHQKGKLGETLTRIQEGFKGNLQVGKASVTIAGLTSNGSASRAIL